MPFAHINRKGDTFYLHGQTVQLRNGRQQRIYFFARRPRDGLTLDALPLGYEVAEASAAGLPVLKRKPTS